jgi:predicted ribosome quality control (RQC) complex YloA/Tae2 family protein
MNNATNVTDSVLKILTSFGLGKDYSNEILKRARIDPLKTKLTPDELESLFNSVRKFMREKPEPFFNKKSDRVYISKISSIKKYSGLEDIYGKASEDLVNEYALDKIPDDVAITFPTINEALDFMIEMPKPEEKEEHLEKSKSKDKLTKVIDAQTKRQKEQEKIVEENQIKGECIYENYALLKDIMDQINLARKKMSWAQIKEKLKGHKIIKSIDEKNGIITLEIGND